MIRRGADDARERHDVVLHDGHDEPQPSALRLRVRATYHSSVPLPLTGIRAGRETQPPTSLQCRTPQEHRGGQEAEEGVPICSTLSDS